MYGDAGESMHGYLMYQISPPFSQFMQRDLGNLANILASTEDLSAIPKMLIFSHPRMMSALYSPF